MKNRVINWHSYDGVFWIRFFDKYNFVIKNTIKRPLLFGDKITNKYSLRIGRYLLILNSK